MRTARDPVIPDALWLAVADAGFRGVLRQFRTLSADRGAPACARLAACALFLHTDPVDAVSGLRSFRACAGSVDADRRGDRRRQRTLCVPSRAGGEARALMFRPLSPRAACWNRPHQWAAAFPCREWHLDC